MCAEAFDKHRTNSEHSEFASKAILAVNAVVTEDKAKAKATMMLKLFVEV